MFHLITIYGYAQIICIWWMSMTLDTIWEMDINLFFTCLSCFHFSDVIILYLRNANNTSFKHTFLLAEIYWESKNHKTH